MKHFIKKTFKDFLTESDKFDDKVGKTFWFEYHCYESPESCDAELWYRSHQQVKVIGVSEWSHDNLQDRIEDATPRVYRIRFNDGFEGDAWEDELVNSPDEFYRPNPPQSETPYSEALINESFLDEPKFYRFTNNEIVGIEDGIYKPRNIELQPGLVDWNDKITNNFNFPNLEKSVHLMDVIANSIYTGKKYKEYGSNKYEITLDDSSNLGWSFFIKQGQWGIVNANLFMEVFPEFVSDLPQGLMNNKVFLSHEFNPHDSNPNINKHIEILLEYKVIGRGKISELLSSPFWGKVPCYVWTEDKVKIMRIS